MTIGVGGSTAEAELAAMKSLRGDVPPIGVAERTRRIERAQELMRAAGVDALWLDVSTSLTYFTGLRLGRSERLHGAVLPARGELTYVCPAFERRELPESRARLLRLLDSHVMPSPAGAEPAGQPDRP